MIASPSLDALAWSASRVPEAIGFFAKHYGCRTEKAADSLPPLPIRAEQQHLVTPWLESIASRLDLDALAVEATYDSIQEMLESSGPTVIRISGSGFGDPEQTAGLAGSCEPRFLVLLMGGRRQVTLLDPNLAKYRMATAAVIQRLRAPVVDDASILARIEIILDQARLPSRSRRLAREALFHELHGDCVLGNCWLIRPNAGARIATLARDARLGRLLGAVAVLHFIQYGLWILSWWLLGWMSVQGRFEAGLFLAWMLLLLSTVPLRIMSDTVGGTLAIRAGTLLKRRLLAGALRLESHEVRQLGIGQLLGRVLESETVESLAVSGGFLALTASVELLLTLLILGVGAGSWLHVALLLLIVGLTIVLGTRYFRSQVDWTQQRLDMTNDLVERMIGHRTRLAQQPEEAWHRGEDEALERYLTVSQQADHRAAILVGVVPRVWLLVGLLGLAPAFITGGRSTVSLAIGVGGVLLAFQALRHLIDGGLRLAEVVIAWKRIELLLSAANRREPIGRPQAASVTPVPGQSLLTAREITFRHRGRSQPVLQGVDMSICHGDRLLLEGASGGGKSTFASLLSGSRTADSGLILLHGLDRETLGAANWRRRVVMSPQFHENHVLMGTMSFNLLMGRRWPPSRDDLEEAERTCRELGLGPLLDRMPSGLSQLLGETGWQLSHGEKSRMYLARALLQGSDLTILDETFAALDPQNLQLALSYVLKHSPTVLVIAHP
jgi:ATP-binding cassette, subfamily B, bacterial